MDFKDIQKRALAIRKKYSLLEKEKYGREWTKEQLMQGFIVDAGELMELVMAKEGIREKENVDSRLAHELSDCLWSIIVIADAYGVDLEESFTQTMDEIEKRI